MAAAVQQRKQPVDPRRTWLGQKAQRTKAIPKHTLQGASLEIFSNQERNDMQKIDVKDFQNEVDKERQIRQEKYMRKLPEFLKKKTHIGL